MDSKGKGGRGRYCEFVIDTYTLLILCIKQITNEYLLCSTGNSTFIYLFFGILLLMYCGDLSGKEIQKGEDTCICRADSFC